MNKLKRLSMLLAVNLSVIVSSVGLALPASAATITTKPSLTLRTVGTCLHPGVEATVKNFGGNADVYFQTDQGIWLADSWFTFTKTAVYDGGIGFNGVYQVDVFMTAPDAGPYATRLLSKSVSATCSNTNVSATPPAGSQVLPFYYLAWYPNRG